MSLERPGITPLSRSLLVHHARDLLHDYLKSYFSSRGYLHVVTPSLVPMPGMERELRYFSSQWQVGHSDGHNDGQNRDLYLRSSPEVHMKQLCSGSEHRPIYQIGPCFRNGDGEHGPWHSPQFEMVEWYTPEQSFDELKDQMVALVMGAFQAASQWAQALPELSGLPGHISVPSLPEVTILSPAECFHRWLNIDLVDEDSSLPGRLSHAGVRSITGEDDFESAYQKAMLEVIEPELAQLEFVLLTDYLPSQRILSTLCPRSGTAQRAEIYVRGVELVHGCAELIGLEEHRELLYEVTEYRRGRGYETPPMDPDFLKATSHLPPDLCGAACGVDRLLALVLGHASLEYVCPFSRHIFPS